MTVRGAARGRLLRRRAHHAAPVTADDVETNRGSRRESQIKSEPEGHLHVSCERCPSGRVLATTRYRQSGETRNGETAPAPERSPPGAGATVRQERLRARPPTPILRITMTCLERCKVRAMCPAVERRSHRHTGSTTVPSALQLTRRDVVPGAASIRTSTTVAGAEVPRSLRQ